MRIEMPEKRKPHDREFRGGAVRIVEESEKAIAQVARDLGVSESALGDWVNRPATLPRAPAGSRSTTWRISGGCVMRLPSCGMERDVLQRSVGWSVQRDFPNQPSSDTVGEDASSSWWCRGSLKIR